MKIFKISNISTSFAIILGSLIIGISIFVTVWIFFGGDANRQKLFQTNPAAQRTTPPTINADQIKKMQEQRAEQMKRVAPTPPKASTTTEE